MNQAGGGPGNGGVPVPNGVSVPPPVGSTSGSSLRYHNPSHHQSHHQPPHYPKHNGYMLNGSLAPIALSSIPVSTSGIPMGTSGMQATTGSRHGAHVPSPTLTQATASPATGATIMTTTNSLQGALSHTHTHSIAKSHSSNSSSGSGSSSSHTGIRGGGAGGAGGAGMAEQQQQIQRERDLGFGSRTTLLGHAHAEISSTSSGSPPIVEVSIPSASQPSSTSGGTTHIGGIGREVGTGGPGQVIDVNQEMQRQLDDYNRSITIVVWYKPHTPPLRIQHITTTFPYFHLGQLPHLTHSLNLVPSPSLPSSSSLSHPSPSHPSYLDTYDPTTKTWELHGVENVRVVRGQQRVLYRVRIR